MASTLLVFSGYGLLLGAQWQTVIESRLMTAPQTAQTVGVVAGVEENRVNGYLAELDARAALLDEREERLASVGVADTGTLLYVTMAGFGLLGLIMLNFYLDHMRRMHLGA